MKFLILLLIPLLAGCGDSDTNITLTKETLKEMKSKNCKLIWITAPDGWAVEGLENKEYRISTMVCDK